MNRAIENTDIATETRNFYSPPFFCLSNFLLFPTSFRFSKKCERWDFRKRRKSLKSPFCTLLEIWKIETWSLLETRKREDTRNLENAQIPDSLKINLLDINKEFIVIEKTLNIKKNEVSQWMKIEQPRTGSKAQNYWNKDARRTTMSAEMGAVAKLASGIWQATHPCHEQEQDTTNNEKGTHEKKELTMHVERDNTTHVNEKLEQWKEMQRKM